MSVHQRLKLFFDGGCRPNPGTMECAVVVRGEAYYRHDAGFGTNSDAEWLAAIHALDVAGGYGETDILLVGDSTLVITQANGVAPCRSQSLADHRAAFIERAARFSSIKIRYIKRSQNLAGIALARLHPR